MLEEVAVVGAGCLAPEVPARAVRADRLVSATARACLDGAGIAPGSLHGARVGVFLGCAGPDASAANRLSEGWGLRGPSLVIAAGEASAAAATHQALASLARGESEAALTGGLGADGCALLLLKPLRDAELDGDRVLAVVLGSAVNFGAGQMLRRLLLDAYPADGPVRRRDVDFVEVLGAGAGPPWRGGLAALEAVLGEGDGRAGDRPLLTAFSRADGMAGMSGLLRTVLALHRGRVPAQATGTAEATGTADTPGREAGPWPRYCGIATAGVSVHGSGGTNAHVVLREHWPDPLEKPGNGAAARFPGDRSGSFARY